MQGKGKGCCYAIFCLCALFIVVCEVMFAENIAVDVSSDVIVNSNTSDISTNIRFVKTQLFDSDIWQFRLYEGKTIVYFDRFLDLMELPSSTFRKIFLGQLHSANIQAYFWECPPISSKSVSVVPFEFVLIPAPGLLRKDINLRAFSSKFENCAHGITSFLNTGKDAQLVVPCPPPNHSLSFYAKYGHLAAFVHGAPAVQVDELFRRVAGEVRHRLDTVPEEKIWLSTSGMGVQWLHVRLDSSPKYYNWKPYTQL